MPKVHCFAVRETSAPVLRDPRTGSSGRGLSRLSEQKLKVRKVSGEKNYWNWEHVWNTVHVARRLAIFELNDWSNASAKVWSFHWKIDAGVTKPLPKLTASRICNLDSLS